ncbi:MAG: hypothetical protein P8N02_15290 [Actinomycetota bacterium]|nr:hypothetical protein [Actinomycetota bacterium]
MGKARTTGASTTEIAARLRRTPQFMKRVEGLAVLRSRSVATD